MRMVIHWTLAILTIISCLSSSFGENEPSLQIGLPEGATARLGKGTISKIAYSPDGTRLAVGSSIGVWIYDAESNKALDLFPMYGVSCLAFSPDGKKLISGSKTHHIILWDVTTGEPLRHIGETRERIYSIAFSPDNRTVTSGHDNGYLILWDTETGKHIRDFSNGTGGENAFVRPFEHTGLIHCLAYSPDGLTLASGGHDYHYLDRGTKVRLWEATTGKHLRLLISTEDEMDYVNSIAFSPISQILAYGWSDGAISLSDIKTDEPPKTLAKSLGTMRHQVLCLAFSTDGMLLASGAWDSNVRLWDLKTNKLLRTLTGHKSEVLSVAFSPDGKTLATCSKEDVRLWNIEGGHNRSIINHFAILDVAFSPDGKTLASGNDDNTVSLWDKKSAKRINTLIGHKERVSNVVFSPHDETLASMDKNNVLLWNVRTGENLHTLSTIDNYSVAFSPDGETLAIEGPGSTVHLYDTQTKENYYTFTKEKHWVIHMTFNPDGQLHALLAGENRNRSLWNIKADKLLYSLTLPTTKRYTLGPTAFNLNTNVIATEMRDNTPISRWNNAVWLWDIRTGEHIRTLTAHLEVIRCLTFSSDGEQLASGSYDETVLLWDLKTEKHPRILIGHNDVVSDVVFSPDSKTLASTSKDGIVLLWDLNKVITSPEENRGE